MDEFKSMDPVSLNDTGSPVRGIIKLKSIEYSIDSIYNKILNNELSDIDIQNIIYRQYTTILDYNLFFKDESRQTMQRLFQNIRFLKNLAMCINALSLNTHQIVFCNKLAYDYILYCKMTVPSANREEISTLLTEISYKVNHKDIIALSSIIGLESAKYLAMARHSSFKEEVNVERVNILLSKTHNLGVDTIYEIYIKLFDNISVLFSTTMFSTIYDEEYKDTYDNITLALICILENMDFDNMREVIKNYSVWYDINGRPDVRFSLYNLHESYTNIKSVILDLLNDGYTIP